MANIFEIIFKGTGLDSLNASLKRKLATLVSLGAAWGAARAAFSNYLEKQDALADLDSGLKQAGQLTDEYRAKLVALADDLERTAGIADEKMLTAMGRLAREGMDPSQADRMVGALKNLAALMGGDVNQAAIMLGKALHGNFDTFSRMGIKVKDLDSLYRELAARGGGLLEARMQTLTGQMKNAQNAFNDFGEAAAGAGVSILGILSGGRTAEEYLRDLGFGLEVVSEGLRDFWGTTDQAGAAADKLRPSLKNAGQGAKDMADDVSAAARQMVAAFEPFLDILQEMRDQQQEIIDSNAEVALAQVDIDEAEGRIKPEEARRKKEEIRTAADKEKLQNDVDAARLTSEQAAKVMADPAATDDERTAAARAKRRADSTLNSAGPRARVIEAKDRASGAQFERDKDQRDDKLNKEAEANRQAKEKLHAKANKIADEQPAVTEADAIAVIEQAMGRRLRNEEVRFKKMTGQIQKAMKQIENGRS